MSLMHVTQDGKCAYCGAKKVLCPICERSYYQKNQGHVVCTDRCRTRKHRQNKKERQAIREALELDDE